MSVSKYYEGEDEGIEIPPIQKLADESPVVKGLWLQPIKECEVKLQDRVEILKFKVFKAENQIADQIERYVEAMAGLQKEQERCDICQVLIQTLKDDIDKKKTMLGQADAEKEQLRQLVLEEKKKSQQEQLLRMNLSAELQTRITQNNVDNGHHKTELKRLFGELKLAHANIEEFKKQATDHTVTMNDAKAEIRCLGEMKIMAFGMINLYGENMKAMHDTLRDVTGEKRAMVATQTDLTAELKKAKKEEAVQVRDEMIRHLQNGCRRIFHVLHFKVLGYWPHKRNIKYNDIMTEIYQWHDKDEQDELFQKLNDNMAFVQVTQDQIRECIEAVSTWRNLLAHTPLEVCGTENVLKKLRHAAILFQDEKLQDESVDMTPEQRAKAFTPEAEKCPIVYRAFKNLWEAEYELMKDQEGDHYLKNKVDFNDKRKEAQRIFKQERRQRQNKSQDVFVHGGGAKVKIPQGGGGQYTSGKESRPTANKYEKPPRMQKGVGQYESVQQSQAQVYRSNTPPTSQFARGGGQSAIFQQSEAEGYRSNTPPTSEFAQGGGQSFSQGRQSQAPRYRPKTPPEFKPPKQGAHSTSGNHRDDTLPNCSPRMWQEERTSGIPRGTGKRGNTRGHQTRGRGRNNTN